MRITGRAARGPLVATVELSLCHDAASEAADSSKRRFHRQMISIAAAITIPVTNAVKQENSSRSLRTTLMAASPCEPCYSQSAAHTSTVAEKQSSGTFGREFLDGEFLDESS